MRASLDAGHSLPNPDGILFNGRGPEETFFAFEPGEFFSSFKNITLYL